MDFDAASYKTAALQINLRFYTWLVTDALREELMGFGLPVGNCHLDVLGGCSEEDIILSMRYYSSDEERAQWAKDFPDFEMPPKEKPPYDRDRLLPTSEQ